LDEKTKLKVLKSYERRNRLKKGSVSWEYYLQELQKLEY
jgi:hypothetical protein